MKNRDAIEILFPTFYREVQEKYKHYKTPEELVQEKAKETHCHCDDDYEEGHGAGFEALPWI